MATPINQLIILTETAGSLDRPASSMPNTRGRGRQATGTTERFTNEIPGARSNFHPRINYSWSENSSPASAAHLVHLQNLCRVHHYALKIPWALAEAQYGQACKHSSNFVHYYLFYFYFFLRYPLKIGDEQDKHQKLALSESRSVHSPKGLFP